MEVLMLVVAAVIAARYLLAVREIRRQRRFSRIGLQAVAYLDYWFYTGISSHLKEEMFIWSVYRAVSRDKRGRQHRNAVIIHTAYNPHNFTFDLESMVRRRVRWLMRKSYWRTGVRFQLAFTQTTKSEIERLRREQVETKEVPTKETTPFVLKNELTSPDKAKIVYIFLGNYGGTVALQYATEFSPKDLPYAWLGVYDTDRRRSDELFGREDDAEGNLKAWLDQKDRFHRPNLGSGFGAGGDPEIARAALDALEKDIVDFLEGAHLVICYACPGGGTGSAVDRLAEMITRQGIPVWARIARPFADDGDDVIERALECYTHLQAISGVCINDAHNEYIYDENNPFAEELRKVGMSEAMNILDTKALRPSVQAPAKLFQVHRTISRDPKDLIQGMIAQSKRSYSLELELDKYGYGQDDFRVDDAIDDLLNDRFQRPDVIKGARRALVIYPDDMNPFVHRRFTEALTAKMRDGKPNHKVEVRKGFSAGKEKPTILLFVGNDNHEPKPDIRPPWMLGEEQPQIQTAAAKGHADLELPVVPETEEEPKVSVRLVFEEGTRVSCEDVFVPASYASEMKNFFEANARSISSLRVRRSWESGIGGKLNNYFRPRRIMAPQRITFKSKRGASAGENRDYMVPAPLWMEWESLKSAGATRKLDTSADVLERRVSGVVAWINAVTGEDPELPPGILELIEQGHAALRGSLRQGAGTEASA